MRRLPTLPLLLAAGLTLGACSKAPDAPPPAIPAAAAPAAPSPEALKSPVPPAGARVFFVDLKDGAEVTSPVTIKFGVEGIDIAPAGEPRPNSGHHHLIVDGELPPADAPAPANDHVLHFGKGQTETSLALTPGTHTLQLDFANALHVPFNTPLVSDKITITVK